MQKPEILIVDNDPDTLSDLCLMLGDEYDCHTVSSASEAERLTTQRLYDIILLDIDLGPGTDGFGILDNLQRREYGVPVIMITRFNDAKTAVRAMKLGAKDFIGKSPTTMELKQAVSRCLRESELERVHKAFVSEAGDIGDTVNLTGKSQAMQELEHRLLKIAPSTATVLVTGESGTGKELIAKFVHRNSDRNGKPCIAVNCAAVTPNLVESELFGHEKGSFTGAISRRAGKFELANRGTLFLDEIGELPLDLQPKLLRAIQEGEICSVGGVTKKVDVRLIAATNRNLEELVAKRHFREDLFHRLNVAVVSVPPLRARKEDIKELCEVFIVKHRATAKRTVAGISDDALRALESFHWPGNVRQLENTIISALLESEDGWITESSLPSDIATGGESESHEIAKSKVLVRFEREYWTSLSQRCDGNISKMADIAKMSRQGVYNILHDLGLKDPAKDV
ncbi:MAG: sigma-54-dependent Fis family transcriptional regulator [Calditrichaeota bacterium]|nr:sigma-54-dependent Fis family transcriptional regulator [Calditrichota bacterium]